MSDPEISVVVCTRDRPGDCLRAVRSLLADLGQVRDECRLLEILVVDQSRDERTSQLLRELGTPHVRRVTMPPAGSLRFGASAGRNRGAQEARGELLLFIDDDVEVLPGWLAGWQRDASEHPDCALLFGPVLPPGPLAAGEFVAEFGVTAGREWGLELFRQGFDRIGLSANMALRRVDFDRLHGLDPCLGPGSQLRASEDLDLGYRVVARGGRLLHGAGAPVVHHGKRSGREAARLTSGYQISIGGMLAKHARIGDRHAWRLLVVWGSRLAGKVVSGLIRGRRPLGARDLLGYLQGIRMSFRYTVDRGTALYRPTNQGV